MRVVLQGARGSRDGNTTESRAVRDLAKLPISLVDAEMIMKAITTMRRYRLSFWDSLIVQAALHGGATTLYTEDLQHGQTIETVSIENPFQA